MELKDYIQNIKQDDNLSIFYHSYCNDGLCSAVIIKTAIERIKKIKVKNIIAYKYYEINEGLLYYLKENNIRKAIFSDISLDEKPEMIKKAEKKTQLMIIDHHQFKHDLNSEKTLFIHASKIKPDMDGSKYPTSKLTYDLFSELIDIKDLDWVSSIGLISDMGYKTWKNFVDETIKKYSSHLEENIMKTEIWKAKTLISTAMMQVGADIDNIFRIVDEAKDYNEIIKNKEFNNITKDISKEISYWIENRNKSEKHGSLIIYEIKPKNHLGSTLATVLTTDYFKDSTLILIADINEEKLVISARNQTGKINLNDFLKEAVKGFPESTAGGHIPAAGASIRKHDLNEFKKRIIEKYNSYLK